jgi:hypothetical protein
MKNISFKIQIEFKVFIIMAVQVTINSITGQSPYDVYICQNTGAGCFYISTIETTPYIFDIPEPYNSSYSYMLKIIDSNNCIISGTTTIQ